MGDEIIPRFHKIKKRPAELGIGHTPPSDEELIAKASVYRPIAGFRDLIDNFKTLAGVTEVTDEQMQKLREAFGDPEGVEAEWYPTVENAVEAANNLRQAYAIYVSMRKKELGIDKDTTYPWTAREKETIKLVWDSNKNQVTIPPEASHELSKQALGQIKLVWDSNTIKNTIPPEASHELTKQALGAPRLGGLTNVEVEHLPHLDSVRVIARVELLFGNGTGQMNNVKRYNVAIVLNTVTMIGQTQTAIINEITNRLSSKLAAELTGELAVDMAAQLQAMIRQKGLM